MMRKATPKVVEITEEAQALNEVEEDKHETQAQPTTVQEKVELTPIQLGLKQLSKIKGKYNRQLLKCQSEEDKKKYQQLIEKIDDARFILKLSNLHKNVVDKVLDYMSYPADIDGIQDMILNEIDAGEF